MSKALGKQMASLKAKQKKQLKENVTITKGTNKNQKVLKEGKPLDHDLKKDTSSNTFGMSKGLTKNMGDYESLRIDVWGNTKVPEGEDPKEYLAELEELLDEVLIESVESTSEM